jgi:hypothetical protein
MPSEISGDIVNGMCELYSRSPFTLAVEGESSQVLAAIIGLL